MKKIFVLLFVFVFASSFNVNNSKVSFNIVGKWVSKEKKDNGGCFIFDNEGYATIIKNGERIGGKEFEMKGEKGRMEYTLDKSTNPIKFDIIVTKLGDNKSMYMKMILKIIDKNTIIMASDFNEIRPKAFTKKNSTTLTRE